MRPILLLLNIAVICITSSAQDLEHDLSPDGIVSYRATTLERLLELNSSQLYTTLETTIVGGEQGKIIFTNGNNPEINLYDADGARTILLDSRQQRGSRLVLYDTMGIEKIRIAANYNGGTDARIVTDEIEIRGGADLAEHFEITGITEKIKPGLLVSLDPDHPGKLMLSSTAYDTKIAGVLSGANGVKPGILMGQNGSIADGEELVTLSGRTYVKANTQSGPINVGDFITSSSIEGQAMRVKNKRKAKGAIIGKAMTELAGGEGFVLVLVNLQ